MEPCILDAALYVRRDGRGKGEALSSTHPARCAATPKLSAQTALDACAAIAMGRGQVAMLPNAKGSEDDHEEVAPGKPPVAVERDGFSPCTPECASRPATISDANDSPATVRDRRCRSNGCADCPAGAWPTA